MKQQPNVFARILLPFCAGIWVLHGPSFTKLNLPLYILSISLLFLLFIFNSLYRSFKVYHYKTIIGGLFFLLWFLLGGLCIVSHQELKDPQHFAHHPAKYLKVYIADEPQNRGGILRLKRG
jgi:competence protein ComEC